MINHLFIDGFKNLDNLSIELRPLTIITGKNSTGKSSLLQAILQTQRNTMPGRIEYADYISSNFNDVRNKYTNSKRIHIGIGKNPILAEIVWTEEYLKDYQATPYIKSVPSVPTLEKDLFYLSANRIGAQNVTLINDSLVSGPAGDFLISTFEREKSTSVTPDLIRYQESYTLSAQLNYWLSFILGIKLELNTEKRQANTVEVKYSSDGIQNILPTQLGAGVSYVTKFLILCLRSKIGDVIMIENPEIHLYPAAQSRLSEFISFMVSHKRQIIMETHSDVIITKIRHEVFKSKLDNHDVVILYKNDITSPFQIISLDTNGSFCPDFPESFFDATLKELLEMD